MMHEENEILICTCCGEGVRNNAEENASYGEDPYPHDIGYGACRSCFGTPSDKDVKSMTDEEFKEALGWAHVTFLEARFDVIRSALKPENQKKWDETPYKKRCVIVTRFVAKGLII